MAKPRIFVISYSTYGHVHTVAQSIKKGLDKSGKVDVELYQFPETLSEDVLSKMHAPPKPDLPVITVDKLPEADGFLFGFPTRFGAAPAQVKAFFDATGGLWAKGALHGKPAGLFFSTGSQHGGQESTAYAFLPNLVHHGIIYVPFGFKNTNLFDNSEVVGGSAWGAGTVAAPDGSRQPNQKELEIAETQGEEFAKIAAKLARPIPTPAPAAAAARQPAAGTTASTTASTTNVNQTATNFNEKAGTASAGGEKRESRLHRFFSKFKKLTT
ncbi:flavoprotein WrbA [Martensiomyces pterosporus]|nr:flavoprotein WrbA [Martensiomyces pterosporus]